MQKASYRGGINAALFSVEPATNTKILVSWQLQPQCLACQLHATVLGHLSLRLVAAHGAASEGRLPAIAHDGA
jgi:hypothetical protein